MMKYLNCVNIYLISFIRDFRQRNNCLAAPEVGKPDPPIPSPRMRREEPPCWAVTRETLHRDISIALCEKAPEINIGKLQTITHGAENVLKAASIVV